MGEEGCNIARPVICDESGWHSLKRDVFPQVIESLRTVGHIEKLPLTDIDLVTVRHVLRLAPLQSIEQLWLWCDVTRRAMRHIIQLPGLRILDVLSIRGPGELGHFDKARSLRVFRANNFLTEQDLLRVAKCESIRELGAQNCALTQKSLSALLLLPYLQSLDIEATGFDDSMAKRLSQSETITSLDIGATRISGAGLSHLVRMKALRSLDLWATRLTEEDLKLLLQLPNLEFLSVGNYEGCASLDPQRVVPLLLELPSLKRVWLDGISLTPEQKLALESKLDSVRVT